MKNEFELNVFTQRVLTIVDTLKEANKVKSDRQFAFSINMDPTQLSFARQGKRDIPDKYWRDISSTYKINVDFLKGTSDEMYTVDDNFTNKSSPVIEAEPVHLAADPADYDNDGSRFEELPDGTLRMRIPVIPNKAFAAGYLQGFQDPEYYEDLEYISIEVFKRHRGHYLAFEVRGDSMTTLEPEYFRQSIFDGVKVAGREIPRQQWRYKLHTHAWNAWVIVHKEKGILIKQIIAHNVEDGIITIHSLNPDKSLYPDEDLHLDDIEQIFNVVKKIDE